jgi:thioredoxin-like negative regulator of GroEL
MSESLQSLISTAVSHAKEQSYEACVEVFAEIFSAHPEHPEAMRALASIMLDMGQTENALSLLADAVDKEHPEPESLHQLSVLLKGQNRLEEAADLLICAVSSAPSRQDWITELQSLLHQLGREADFQTYFPDSPLGGATEA